MLTLYIVGAVMTAVIFALYEHNVNIEDPEMYVPMAFVAGLTWPVVLPMMIIVAIIRVLTD